MLDCSGDSSIKDSTWYKLYNIALQQHFYICMTVKLNVACALRCGLCSSGKMAAPASRCSCLVRAPSVVLGVLAPPTSVASAAAATTSRPLKAYGASSPVVPSSSRGHSLVMARRMVPLVVSTSATLLQPSVPG